MSISDWVGGKRAEGTSPKIALGTMNFGGRTDEAEAARIVDIAFERGVRLFDTANLYADGRSEEIVGRALRQRRGDVLIATKVGLARSKGQVEGLSRDAIHRSIGASLRRLSLDFVDLLYVHAPDRKTTAEETIGALNELVKEGRVRAWGVSNFSSWRALELRDVAVRLGAPKPVISQVLYNPMIRQIELEHLDFCRAKDIHITVYNALAGGLLSGKHAGVAEITKGSRFDGNRLYQKRYWTARLFEHVAALRALADELSVSLLALTYGWLAARDIDSVLVGPASVAHLEEALDGLAKPLDSAAVKKLDDLCRDFVGTDASYAR